MTFFDNRLAPGESILVRVRLHWLNVVLSVLLALTVGVMLEIVLFLLLLVAQFLSLQLGAQLSRIPVDFSLNPLYLAGLLPIAFCGLVLGLLNYFGSQVVLTNQRLFVRTGVFRRRLFEFSLNLPRRFRIRTPALGRALGFRQLVFLRADGTPQRFAFVDRRGEFEAWLAQRAANVPGQSPEQPDAAPKQPVIIVEETEFPEEYTARMLREASQHIKHGNPEAARKIVTRLIQSDPDNANVWYMAGYLSSSPEKKRQAFERALEINPRHRQARQKLDALQERG